MKKQYLYSLLGFILGFVITISACRTLGYDHMDRSIQDLFKGSLPLSMFLSFIGFIYGNIKEDK